MADDDEVFKVRRDVDAREAARKAKAQMDDLRAAYAKVESGELTPPDNRAEMQEARKHGLAKRHESREARAIRRQKDQFMLMSLRRPEIAERFERDAGTVSPDGCRLWQGRIAKDGYGRFAVWPTHTQKVSAPAHRLALLLSKGLPPSPEMQAAHSCRNRHCVAPEHLRWATAEENAADRKRDGTQNRTVGRMHGMAKLTPDQIEAIRREYALGGFTQRQLAKRYDIAQSAISNIVNKRRWAFLDEPDVAESERAYAEAREVGIKETP
jgi:hypothetical protein